MPNIERTRDNMLEGPLVFVDIDTQRDFLEPTGALYIRGSAEILPNLERLTRFARSRQIPILATSCAHRSDDPELKIFPPHCMVGTTGQERVAETACPDSVVLDVDRRLSGELPRHLTLLKRELDVFSRPDADELIARYNRTGPTFVVYGVATDYCVSKAVDGLRRRNCRVAVVADAIRAIDLQAEPVILNGFVQNGSMLTLTEVVCRE
jgi:nicotinamidase/pyrazinamidase